MAEQDNISIVSLVDPQEDDRSDATDCDSVSSGRPAASATDKTTSGPSARAAGTSLKRSRSGLSNTLDEHLATWLESVDFEPPAKRIREQKKSMKAELILLCRTYRVTDREMWRELVHVDGHEVSDYHNANIHRYRFLETVDDAAKLALFSIKPLTWQERVEQVVVPRDRYDAVCGYVDRFVELLKPLGDSLGVWWTIFTIMSLLPESRSKVRTVYLQGLASTGKSAIMGLLSCVYDAREIGRFGPQGSTSPFWFDDLVGKEIYLGDEAPGNELNIQQYLLLLEGNPALKAEIKYGGKPHLRPRPVVIACNHNIYANCQAFAQPVLDRVVAIRLRQRVPNGVDVHPDARTAPYVLHLLYKRARQWDINRRGADSI